jgi:hypothetical protein
MYGLISRSVAAIRSRSMVSSMIMCIPVGTTLDFSNLANWSGASAVRLPTRLKSSTSSCCPQIRCCFNCRHHLAPPRNPRSGPCMNGARGAPPLRAATKNSEPGPQACKNGVPFRGIFNGTMPRSCRARSCRVCAAGVARRHPIHANALVIPHERALKGRSVCTRSGISFYSSRW